jgi:REP element-mobilizing transposase RayT
LKSRIEIFKDSHPDIVEELKNKYRRERNKYLKAFDDLLGSIMNPAVNLAKTENTEVIIQALKYWEGRRILNHAYTIMPNHVHWIVELHESDEMDKEVYLQDILHSVKRFSANRINKLEDRQGSLWQKESFETTIRNERHLYYAINYTLNNPVAAGLVKDWKSWPGSWCKDGNWDS